jgi:hypothetical protein
MKVWPRAVAGEAFDFVDIMEVLVDAHTHKLELCRRYDMFHWLIDLAYNAPELICALPCWADESE